MKISVILSTYNSPDYLEKVLVGYAGQTRPADEIVIADDGSGDPTRIMIDKLRDSLELPLIHVWHPDDGFQKTRILNRATEASTGDYLVFSDGDCIPRKDFLETHAKFAFRNIFLSGGCFRLPMDLTETVCLDDIREQRLFDADWLLKRGMNRTRKILKLSARGWKARFLNFITTTRATWNGHNASAWKEDLLRVNGFDERMKYGGEDRELGERLINAGIKSKQIRFSAICVHLDHSRGYVDREAWRRNDEIRRVTKREKRVWTDHGINSERPKKRTTDGH